MYLNFLWHMHQPDYRDSKGVMQMPWVFLHAIKDYYDMPWMVSLTPNIKATFNLTPPLIGQIELYYENAHTKDKFLNLWLKHPSLLGEEDKHWLIKICKSANYEKMITQLPRFVELYANEQYDHEELIELEVLFMLSWCGVYLRENNQTVSLLIQKASGFGQDDKRVLLSELEHFVSTIFDFYKELHLKGTIAISTTPLNHPILPLLLDMDNALKANATTNIPKEHRPLFEDAKMHVQKAQTVFYERFGFNPLGFWPAEGAVDEKTLSLLTECGIQWIATDEQILFKSLNSFDKKTLYHPYAFKGMNLCFRDHYLSDLIGFEYRHKEDKIAADHFVQQLEAIERSYENPLVSVILDGENAWEFFDSNAYGFFTSLYARLQDIPWCQTITMDEVCKLPSQTLPSLSPGSWIHGEFNTWVGHKEKTRAWELLFMAKRDYEHHKHEVSEETQQQITHHFLASECSDWFWWYGDDHFSDFGAEFDALFRSHLIRVYDLLGIAVPTDLLIPIIENKSAHNFWLQPQSDISPSINGKRYSFFDWIGCGVVDEGKIFSTMDRLRGPIKRILYGQDRDKLYFAFETQSMDHCLSDAIEIIIEPGQIRGTMTHENHTIMKEGVSMQAAFDELLELCIEKQNLNSHEISIRFEIQKEGKVIQTLPGFGELKITIDDDYSRNWFV
jgi:alpha-amylase/alpha-mannosidase (GH57 family)